jgi:hypothetical protein
MGLALLGAIAMANFTVSLFFIRFWKKTHDRFFLFFAVSFFIEGAGRVMLVLTQSTEQEPLIYIMRLCAFLVIIYAILDKNRRVH